MGPGSQCDHRAMSKSRKWIWSGARDRVQGGSEPVYFEDYGVYYTNARRLWKFKSRRKTRLRHGFKGSTLSVVWMQRSQLKTALVPQAYNDVIEKKGAECSDARSPFKLRVNRTSC